jgi:hypothetical protein
MATTDAIWIPSYYRRPRRFEWARAAGGPKLTDCLAGAVFAALVLTLLLERVVQHQATSPAVATTTTLTQADINADHGVYLTQASTRQK